MLDKLKKISAKLLEIWKKYTKRQKVIIISSVAAVFLTLIILIVILNSVTYEPLYTFEDTKTAKEAIDVLASNEIEYKLGEDDRTISVNVRKKQDAVLVLADSEIMSQQEFTVSQLLDYDLSTTSTEKMLRNHLYLQSSLNQKIKQMQGIDVATVLYFPTDKSNSILLPEKEISCSVMITTNEEFDTENEPLAIATLVAYALGNQTTDKIKIVNQYGIVLFGGPDEEIDEEKQNDRNLSYRKKVETWVSEKQFELAILNGYSMAEIVPALDIKLDKESVLYTEYLAGEGLEQGLYDTYVKISSESTGQGGDIPGTDSNDETDYYIQTSSTGNSSYDELNIKYKPSERVTETLKSWKLFEPETSSMGLTLTRVETKTEEELELLGLLEGTTFDEYVANNSERQQLEVTDDLYELFSDASGIPRENIKITAYMQPNFIAREEVEKNWAFWLEIALAVLIAALLVFVIFRGMKEEEVIETEPELSVERLLATTKENQSLEDIEFSDKSETRIMIEKFVDENPAAVANLLRNWLADDGWN